MEIRRLTDADIEVFVDDLWVPFAEEMADLDAFNALSESAREHAIEHRRRRLEADDRIDFVAVDGGTLIAEAAANVRESPPVFERGDTLYVTEVFVRPDYRGRGLAADLLDAVETWGRDQGCTRAGLSVHRDNEAAQELYRARDYAVEKHTMRKRL